MASYAIRQATIDDLDTVLAFSQKLFEAEKNWFNNSNMEWTYSKEGIKFNKEFLTAAEDKVCYLAEVGGKAIGYIMGRVEQPNSAFPGRATRLMNILVDDDWRSKGVGNQLVEMFYSWSRGKMADRIYVHGYAPNRRAMKFYERQGFMPYENILWHKLGNDKNRSR